MSTCAPVKIGVAIFFCKPFSAQSFNLTHDLLLKHDTHSFSMVETNFTFQFYLSSPLFSITCY